MEAWQAGFSSLGHIWRPTLSKYTSSPWLGHSGKLQASSYEEPWLAGSSLAKPPVSAVLHPEFLTESSFLVCLPPQVSEVLLAASCHPWPFSLYISHLILVDASLGTQANITTVTATPRRWEFMCRWFMKVCSPWKLVKQRIIGQRREQWQFWAKFFPNPVVKLCIPELEIIHSYAYFELCSFMWPN